MAGITRKLPPMAVIRDLEREQRRMKREANHRDYKLSRRAKHWMGDRIKRDV